MGVPPPAPREGDLKNFVHKMNQIFLVSCMTLCVCVGGGEGGGGSTQLVLEGEAGTAVYKPFTVLFL